MEKVSSLLRRLLRSFLFLGVFLGTLQNVHPQAGTLLWEFAAGRRIDSSPAVGPEGVIYFGAGTQVFAVNPDGTERWRFSTGDTVSQPISIAADGTIYAVDDDGTLYALNPDGVLNWSFAPGSPNTPNSEIAVAADGTVYYSVSSTVYAVNPDGSPFWNSLGNSTFGVIGGISIGMEGIVLANAGRRVVGLAPSTGAQEFAFLTPAAGNIVSAAALATDGTIYAGNRAVGDNFVAINPDGGEKWRASGEAQITNTASTAVDGTIYVPVNFRAIQGINRGFVIALAPNDGSEIWRYETDGGVGTTPLVGFDGTLYFGTTANKLIALSPNGSELWVFQPQSGGGSPQMNASPSIAPNGTIYIGSTNGSLYAVRSDSPGLSASSWPKLQRDAFNTGRFGSDVTRRNWFAPHVFQARSNGQVLADVTVSIRHTGGSAGSPRGTVASFRISVLNRDGSVNFIVEDSVDPGQTKDIVLSSPNGGADFQGSAIVDASIRDGLVLAPFLTWRLDVTEEFNIGAFFSDATEAALVHHFPAESNSAVGIGIAVQNIGDSEIQCDLEFFNSDGTERAQTVITLAPRGSNVGFFDELVNPGGSAGFLGSATFSCNAPVIAVAVSQNRANAFPTDRLTIKGVN